MSSSRLRENPPAGRACPGASRLDDGGYILVAMLVGIAIASIWMAAALPSWRQQAIREKEAELVFRGEQYARAIRLYAEKMNGTYPTNLDDLVSQHVLRKKWKDPITNDEFSPKVGCLQPGVGQPGVGGPGIGAPGGVPRGPGGPTGPGGVGPTGPPIQRPGGRLGLSDFSNPDPQVGAPGGRPQVPATPQIPATPGQRPQIPGQVPGQVPGGQFPGGQIPGSGGGGICGVQSKSKAASIKTYKGQQEYDLWQFDIQTAQLDFQSNVMKLSGGAGSAPGVGVPMMPGRGGVPTGPRGAQPPGRGGPAFPFPGGPAGPAGGGPGRGITPGGVGPGGVPSTPPSFPGGRGRI